MMSSTLLFLSVRSTGPAENTAAVVVAWPRSAARATPRALVSIGDSPFSTSSFTISFTRSCAARVPSTRSVRLPATAFVVSFSWSASAARSIALMCLSIFSVAGPSATLMRICSEGPSLARRPSFVSSESTKPSVRATHSPVSTRRFTSLMAFFTALSFPRILRQTPLMTGVAPLAMRRSSRCLRTRATSSAVASGTSLMSADLTSPLASARASSSAPRPTRFSAPWELRCTPATMRWPSDVPAEMVV
mmetsp:Transcript_49554/g.139851  ORF Transcript_49554/g.139851 Transcript_49554/m.139851 type:complete len:248 (-) Transcript_49554:635-1378(-)